MIQKGGYTEKKDQRPLVRELCIKWTEEFGKNYPAKTIGNHHYIRRRHLENFLYDFYIAIEKGLKEKNVIQFD